MYICHQGSMAPRLHSCPAHPDGPLLSFYSNSLCFRSCRLSFKLSISFLTFPGAVLVPSYHPIPFLDFLGFSALILPSPFPGSSPPPLWSPFWLLLCKLHSSALSFGFYCTCTNRTSPVPFPLLPSQMDSLGTVKLPLPT